MATLKADIAEGLSEASGNASKVRESRNGETVK